MTTKHRKKLLCVEKVYYFDYNYFSVGGGEATWIPGELYAAAVLSGPAVGRAARARRSIYRAVQQTVQHVPSVAQWSHGE